MAKKPRLDLDLAPVPPDLFVEPADGRRKPRKIPTAEIPVVPNPEPRILVMVDLDTSGSMGTECRADPDDPTSPLTTPIQELNKALPRFKSQCCAHSGLRLQLEIATVQFNSIIQTTPFQSVTEWQPPELTASSGTHLGEGLNTGLDLLEGREQELKLQGIPVEYRFALLFSDGAANDAWEYSERAIERIRAYAVKGRFTFLPIGINQVDLDLLNRYSPKGEARLLKGLSFSGLFTWLIKSLHKASVERT